MTDSNSKLRTAYVPEDTELPELTFRALALGVVMAIVLGAANAYLGLRAGVTVSAVFPAAVVAMAVLRPLGGSILEENIARTAGSTGEALVAGAIFTFPAFVISGAWTRLHYWDSTLIMMVGGILGVLFIIILRRPMVVDSGLPFPESIATAEITKAGQSGASGAGYVFRALGLSAAIELLKNSQGIHLFEEYSSRFFAFGSSKIALLGQDRAYSGGIYLETPAASPALLGVGYIVGPKISAALFSGAMMGWCLLVPLGLFLNPAFAAEVGRGADWTNVAVEVWKNQVRPLAVGTMIVAALQTLFGLRSSLREGITKAFADLKQVKAGRRRANRLETDLDLVKSAVAAVLCSIPLFFVYWHFTKAAAASFVLTLVMIVLGFLLCAVAGYLAGTIGNSNSPVSGLTLSALIIAALLMVLLGATGVGGVGAVLAVAGVVCCSTSIAGDMLQDLKIGHILGGTPWRMETAHLIAGAVAAMVLVFPLMALEAVYGIGGKELPAPQAGLMALLAKGVVGGQMPWALVIMGMFLAIALILIGAPSPMLIAVGMYLPFSFTASIFSGGAIKWLFERRMESRKLLPEEKMRAENTGILVASGLVAGESLMAVAIAFLILGANLMKHPMHLPVFYTAAWPGVIVFGVLAYSLIETPLGSIEE